MFDLLFLFNFFSQVMLYDEIILRGDIVISILRGLF